MEIGRWEKGAGVTMTKSMTRWYRRNDLQGAVVINSLSPFLCWASFTKDENGRVVGSEGYFQVRHLEWSNLKRSGGIGYQLNERLRERNLFYDQC